MADWDFDLFGDPHPQGSRGRGRPPHEPSIETRRKCVVLAAVGKTPDEIAAALSITPKTLRKHYSRELRDRDHARLKVEGKLLGALVVEVDKGNVSANKELQKRIDRAVQQGLSDRIGGRAPATEKPAPLGKKEAAKVAAGEVQGKFAPPAPPSRLTH